MHFAEFHLELKGIWDQGLESLKSVDFPNRNYSSFRLGSFYDENEFQVGFDQDSYYDQ